MTTTKPTDDDPGETPGRRGVIGWFGHAAATPLRAWRRSLQLRVVTTTIVLSAIVIALVGVLLQNQIAEGVIDTKQRSAVAEAYRGFEEAQVTLDQATTANGAQATGVGLRINEIVQRLYERSGDSEFDIVALGSSDVDGGSSLINPRSTGDVDRASVPEALREAVTGRSTAYQTFGVIRSDVPGVPDRRGLIIGSALDAGDAGDLELYYLFPLDQEEATLELVQRTLLIACVLLVGLIGLISWFVVRQTVTPVRLAARVAGRLAAGRLQERLDVRGEDDMARLAQAFNKMAESLQQQIRQLEELSRMQQRFVSDVSHELRTPLTTVRMAADLIYESRPDFDPPTARAAELLQNELDRFEHLLQELLEISRFDAGAAELELEVVDCRALASQVVATSRTLADRGGTELRLHLPDQPCVAEVDPRRIERILRNLVENAIEHGERRPIDVAVGADDRAVAFTVRDHGIGLKPGEAASVFNRFWRGDPSRTRTIGGTGLGLAIAQEDTNLHNGWLQAWGRVGVGSQFRLTLPRKAGGSVDSSPLPIVPRDLGPARHGRDESASEAVVPAEVNEPAYDASGPEPSLPEHSPAADDRGGKVAAAAVGPDSGEAGSRA